MPLPAALQARLLKRGIIDKSKGSEPASKKVSHSEKSGVCPNARNPYHTCVEYCRERYGADINKPKDYRTIPPPPGWFLVPDSKSGHPYYWHPESNKVSWHHPLDPKADITLPASVIEKQKQQPQDSEVQPNREIPAPPGVEKVSLEEKEPTPSVGKHPSLMKGSQKRQENALKRKISEGSGKSKKIARLEEEDPMDPSSYSDAPKGTWSTGLVHKGEAKTGADTTANGPLFQMRPYPSPGAVLRQNQALSSTSSSK